jgi:hypothetical protein
VKPLKPRGKALPLTPRTKNPLEDVPRPRSKPGPIGRRIPVRLKPDRISRWDDPEYRKLRGVWLTIRVERDMLDPRYPAALRLWASACVVAARPSARASRPPYNFIM